MSLPAQLARSTRAGRLAPVAAPAARLPHLAVAPRLAAPCPRAGGSSSSRSSLRLGQGTAARCYSSAPASSQPAPAMPVFHDTTHPNGIYYHVLSAQRIALSYLAAAPRSATSPAVLASFELPEKIDESQTPAQLAQAHADVMEENAAFRQVMHRVLQGAAVDDGMLQYEAYLRKSGFAHVADQREQLMPGRIPNPENILAMIAFENQELVPASYAPNDVHRLVTRELGVMALRPEWHDRVRRACEEAEAQAGAA